MLRHPRKPELTPWEAFMSATILEAYRPTCLGDYIPAHAFPLHVYLGKMASYFERKEEKTDCRGNRMAPHLSGQGLF